MRRVPRSLAAGIVAALLVVVVIVVVVAVKPFSSSTSSSGAAPAPSSSQTQTTPAPPGTVNPATAPVPPAHGAYFGARAAGPQDTQKDLIQAVDNLQQQIGRKLAIVHVYLKWSSPFPTTSDTAFMQQGSMLLLSWAGTDTKAIASGQYDALIKQRAQEIKATGKKIFLEWRWEMDRPNLIGTDHSPADYIAAWDHIRSIFASEHVDNVAWVWCPTAKGFAGGNAAAFYPGDSEVDWICADAYPGRGPYRSFASTVQPFLTWASQRSKPVMIGEYGVPATYSPEQRAQWLRDAAAAVQKDSQIKALVYFDADAQQSYTLPTGSSALQVFRSLANNDYFDPASLSSSG